MNMQYRKGQIVGYVPVTSEPVALPIPKRWYFLRVHPNGKFKVMKAFRQRDISGWLPLMTTMQDVTRYRRGELQTNEVVRKRLAKVMARECFRNTKLEDYHAGRRGSAAR
jgi:hypothetical protein